MHRVSPAELLRNASQLFSRGVLDRLVGFLRHEAVLCIAFVCACAALIASGNVQDVPDMIDWRVLSLLFCLMAAVAGLRESGVLVRAAQALVAGERTRRAVCMTLVMLPFFTSMLITNDVALLTFVPIAIIALQAAGWRESLARVVVLQAIAANLGGMVMPFGNPQNLFIFTTYDLGIGDFFRALAPFGVLAFVLMAAACLSFGSRKASVSMELVDRKLDVKRLILHTALFVVSVLAVVRVVPFVAAFCVVAACLLLFDRRVFGQVDYALLATFVCFFVFSGTIADSQTVQNVLGGWMQAHPMLTSLGASQVISNVPAAVLLSGFTENWHSLLIGVDLGGLGTPIASLASLIAFRLYAHSQGADAFKFMKEFGIANAVVLALMVVLYAILFV